jgi:hypothetical protein
MPELSELKLEPVPGVKRRGQQVYFLTAPLRWADADWTGPSGAMVETVEVGFRTDIATMPWSGVPWPFVPAAALAGLVMAFTVSPWFILLALVAATAVAIKVMFPVRGKWDAAAVLHDHMIATKDRPRTEADAIFERVMLYCGVAAWKARLMRLAVGLGRKFR